MSVFDMPDFDGHEQVAFFSDAGSGLKAIIAIHNTNRGPALGGCRMWSYADSSEALTDALRLSKGMTYKAAITDLALGGGKSVILGDARADKTEAMMQAMGEAVDRMGGRYIVAEDVGTTVPDMDLIRTRTHHVAGVTGGAGDPSPSTAHGVYIGIRAAVRHRLDRNSLDGIRVSVQGVGSVGHSLCERLHGDGAQLWVTDISEEALERTRDEFGATVVGPDAIYDLEVDVYAPCALGATVNDDTIPRLRAPIVAGSANNVLAEERHGLELRERNILYAPDYVINAGGLIDVARFPLGISLEEAKVKLEQIDDTLTEIFARAETEGLPTSEIADRIAEERFQA